MPALRVVAALAILNTVSCKCSGSEPKPAPSAPGGEAAAAPPAEPGRDSAPSTAGATDLVPEKPPGDPAEAVFSGWPYLLAPGEERMLCAIERVDPGEGAKVVVPLGGGCDMRADEVELFYVPEGEPGRKDAVSELGRRLPVCGPEGHLLSRVTWPDGASEVEVSAWELSARWAPAVLTVTWGEGEPVPVEVPAWASAVEALFATDDRSLVVARVAGKEDGHRLTECLKVPSPAPPASARVLDDSCTAVGTWSIRLEPDPADEEAQKDTCILSNDDLLSWEFTFAGAGHGTATETVSDGWDVFGTMRIEEGRCLAEIAIELDGRSFVLKVAGDQKKVTGTGDYYLDTCDGELRVSGERS